MSLIIRTFQGSATRDDRFTSEAMYIDNDHVGASHVWINKERRAAVRTELVGELLACKKVTFHCIFASLEDHILFLWIYI